MNILVKYKKRYLDHINTLTGEWSTDSLYLVEAKLEYYDTEWQPTGFEHGTGIAQNFGVLQMFPNQWDEFRSILETGSEARPRSEIRWVEEEDE